MILYTYIKLKYLLINNVAFIWKSNENKFKKIEKIISIPSNLLIGIDRQKKTLKDIKLDVQPRSVAVLIGPEGGFSQAEIENVREYGFQTVSLGPRILRAETAPVVALALLQSLWGDL